MGDDARQQLRKMARGCLECANHYSEKPGTAGVAAICDLYRTIARLADLLSADAGVTISNDEAEKTRP